MTTGPLPPADTTAERGHPGDQRPTTLQDLIAALTGLPDLGNIDRARAIPGLIEASKTVLSRERGAAMATATAPGPGGISRAELARQLGISRSKVTEAIAASPLQRVRRGRQ